MRLFQSSSASHGKGTPSYFADEPGAQLPPPGPAASISLTSPELAETPLTSEGFTFRHFPAENVEPTTEAFTSNPKVASILRSTTYGSQSSMVFEPPTAVIPQGNPVRAIPGLLLDDAIMGAQHPQSALGVESEPPYASNDDLFGEDNRERVAGPGSNVKFAASGLTHLGPIRDAFKHTGAVSSMPGSSFGYNQSQRSARSNSKHGDGSQGSRSSQAQAGVIFPEKSDKEISPAISSFSVPTRSSEESGSPIVTMRFEHREDENGHHILIGREGKLTRCEDEPIRVPGAVQGFGVLMVLHDDRTTGKLPVRQVSEASYLLRE